jgi:hypothetical protein
MIAEQWKGVPTEPYFEVSNLGRVRSIERTILVPASWYREAHKRHYKRRLLRPALYQHGYFMVTVSSSRVGGRRVIRRRSVHTMVLEAFKGPPPTPEHEGRHLDGKPSNCRLANLEWGTRAENASDRVRHGTAHRPKGTRHGQAKITDDQVRALRLVYRRYGSEHLKLGQQLGISPSHARNIAKGRGWSHVD